MKRRVYLKVTNDELELPIAMGDTAAELARQVGTSTNTIHSAIHHARHGGRRSCYKVVEIDDEEEEKEVKTC